MPFDLAPAARALRAQHGDAMGFRRVLLDHLFAAGCGVREQAVALEFGDALCVRTGQALDQAGPALCLFALDLDPPGGHAKAQWPVGLASLGGADVAIGWLAALRAVLKAEPKAPWQLVYVRGPALGLGAYAASLQAELPAATRCVQLVPSVAQADGAQDLDLLALELTRDRDVWRLPACDFTYAVCAEQPQAHGLQRLREWIAALGPNAAWTLHDLHLQPGSLQRLTATLRTDRPAPTAPAGMAILEAQAGQRLSFPLNDALGALTHLEHDLAQTLHGALSRPLQLSAQPGGLHLHAVVPPGLDEDALPPRAQGLGAQWRIEALARSGQAVQRGLAIGAQDLAGPVPAGLEDAELWRLPLLSEDQDLASLSRSLLQLLR